MRIATRRCVIGVSVNGKPSDSNSETVGSSPTAPAKFINKVITMPFYDYKCNDCGHVMHDQLKKYTEKIIECKQCNKNTAEQQFSGKFAAHGLPNGHIGSRVRRG